MPHRSDWPLQHDLARALRRRGMFDKAQSAWVLSVANTIAKDRFVATAFRDGHLVLTARNLPAAELQIAKEELRKTINKRLGQEVVRTIQVKQS